MARCRWGDDDTHTTTPFVLETTRLQCASYVHTDAAAHTRPRSLNAQDYTPLTPGYTVYDEPALAVFTRLLSPEGGITEGGTVVTVYGEGFDVLPPDSQRFGRCRWGSIYNTSTDTPIIRVNATELVCLSAALPVGFKSLSLAMNGQQFIATGLLLKVFPQPSGFTEIALNTTDLNLGPRKWFGILAGGPVGEASHIWLRGQGFLAFENSSTPLGERRTLCRWGASADAPVTRPTRVEDDLVVCEAYRRDDPGEAPLLESSLVTLSPESSTAVCPVPSRSCTATITWSRSFTPSLVS